MKRSKLFQKILIIVTLASILVSTLFCFTSSAVRVDAVDLTVFEGYWELLPDHQANGSDSGILIISGEFSVDFAYEDFTYQFNADGLEFNFEQTNNEYFRTITFNSGSIGVFTFTYVNTYQNHMRYGIYNENTGDYDYTYASSDYELYFSIDDVTEAYLDVYESNSDAIPFDVFSNFVYTTPPPPPPPPPPKVEGMLDKILNVFLDVGNWITSALGTLAGLFWSFELQKLTLLGMLAVIPVGISMMFIFFYMIKGWCQF